MKSLISERAVEFVTFYLTDIDGRLRQVTIPAEEFSEKRLELGIGFDASNFGFAEVERSDMILKPDLALRGGGLPGEHVGDGVRLEQAPAPEEAERAPLDSATARAGTAGQLCTDEAGARSSAPASCCVRDRCCRYFASGNGSTLNVCTGPISVISVPTSLAIDAW